jgi:hypothetical protein
MNETIFLIFIAIGASGLIAATAWHMFLAKANATTDYVAKLNEITKPQDYDPNENSKPLLDEVAKNLTSLPNLIMDSKIWPADAKLEELEVLKHWLSSNSEVIRKIILAGHRKYYVNTYSSTNARMSGISGLNVKEFRRLTFSLAMYAKIQALEGNHNSFVESISAIFELSSQLAVRSTLVEQMVAMAINGMVNSTILLAVSKTEFEPSFLKLLQDKYESNPLWHFQLKVLEPELLYAKDWAQFVFTDDGNGYGRIVFRNLMIVNRERFQNTRGRSKNMPWYKGVYFSFLHPGRKATLEALEKFYVRVNECTEVSPISLKKSRHTFDSAQSRFRAEFQRITRSYPLLKELSSSFDQLCELNLRHRSYHSAMPAILAARRFALERGAPAKDMDELIETGYLKRIPMDAYSDKPINYKQISNDDFVLYSVGNNLKDDGGEDDDDLIFWPLSKSTFFRKAAGIGLSSA